jgi:ribosomal-protein-alanine N-acetyltransferase
MSSQIVRREQHGPRNNGNRVPRCDLGYSVSILPTTAADMVEIHAMEKDSFPSPWPRKAFLRLLGSRTARFLTAFDHGKVVGYAGMTLESSAHILNIAVHRDYRRRGIGSRLLSLLLEAAADHGTTSATLEVRASNVVAQNMYRKFGFRRVAIKKGYYAAEDEDAVVMAKEIGRGTDAPAPTLGRHPG